MYYYILSFSEVFNISVVHINMDTSKEKVINVNIKDRKIIHFKACAKGLFCTNLNDPTMITNPTDVSLKAHSYLSMVKQNLESLLILKIKRRAESSKVTATSSLDSNVHFKTYLKKEIYTNSC